MRSALFLALLASLAAATPTTPAPPSIAGLSPDASLCCPPIDNFSPVGTLTGGELLSNELCCGYSDGTSCCYALTGALLGVNNFCIKFLFPC